MPRTTFPRDRFDDLPADAGRVGAHRAENPRMRGWVVLFWAVLATVVLIAVGIFGTLLVSGRVVLFPTPEPTVAPLPIVTPVVDTTFDVLVLNATPESGLATQTKDVVVAAGWAEDTVLASEAGSTDFAETTIYYYLPEDEAAAAGLAEVIGGARIEQSDVYQPAEDPEARQLTIVIGLDRTSTPPDATPAP
ncbi:MULTISPECIES: LytR C-terminal domain-containing protein [unclassified Microbacterium]|uniref:LytR C-terminal domain-containing protein n=1 Tax=unclassified Microbacterium TaxID=2609290 RepID=UPI00214A94BC|nr:MULTISPECIES: LytR C-terminal domain-containing protein [unclassified Microbacterium]MCR2810694.1 LytR C-terminal domain-containing protein [Microbacterium sp. zg.B185]WIM18231.1 LytR C-terminal domain-containing protein [Microbacterium sp. zg-B185]